MKNLIGFCIIAVIAIEICALLECTGFVNWGAFTTLTFLCKLGIVK